MNMTRTFVTAVLMFGGLLAIVLPASAEDGGQYHRGGSSIAPHQDASTFQR